MIESKWSEAERSNALAAYNILDTPPEADFDNIVKIAAAYFQVPVVLISLVENKRQWFKAQVGLGLRETPRSSSICAHAMYHRDIFVIPDLTEDVRFKNNPLVTNSPKIRFYAGSALVTPEGLPLGTLCLIDYQARILSESEKTMLGLLSRQVMTQLEVRRSLHQSRINEDRLRVALQSSSFVGVWDWNPSQDIIFPDARMVDFFSGDAKWITEGAPLSAYAKAIHPDDLPRFNHAVNTTLNQGGAYFCEYRLIQRDGTMRWVEARGHCNLDEAGRPTRFPGTVVDVTERKKTENQLYEISQRLHTLMNALPVGVSVSDDLSCQRITGNPAVRKQFEVTTEDNLSASASESNAAGRKFRFFRNGKEINDQELPLQRAVNENCVIPSHELEIIMPNGRRWFADASGAPLHDREGRVIGGVAVTMDITPRKEAEDLMRRLAQTTEERRQELEQRVEERTASLKEVIEQMEEFSYSVSHDLRAPLRAMQSYAQAVMEDYGAKLDSQGHHYLQRIIDCGLRMDRLTQDVLTYSKIPRTGLELKPVALEKLIDDLIDQTFAAKLEQDVQITVERPLLPLLAHESLLGQAVSNLLGNAIKFAATGRKPKVKIWNELRGTQSRLWIEDNGIGIKEEYQTRIWGMFERVHPSNNQEGTGIGLAIVRKAVERMGGSVGMESDGENGSKFWLQLAAAEGI